MAVELDPEHVIDFAFEPIRSWPDPHNRRQRLTIGNLRFHADTLVAYKRVQNPKHIELLLALGIVHGRDVHAVVKLVFIAQKLEHPGDKRAVDHEIVLAKISQRLKTGTVPRLIFFSEGRCPGHGNRTGGCSGSGRLRRRRGRWWD